MIFRGYFRILCRLIKRSELESLRTLEETKLETGKFLNHGGQPPGEVFSALPSLPPRQTGEESV